MRSFQQLILSLLQCIAAVIHGIIAAQAVRRAAIIRIVSALQGEHSAAAVARGWRAKVVLCNEICENWISFIETNPTSPLELVCIDFRRY